MCNSKVCVVISIVYIRNILQTRETKPQVRAGQIKNLKIKIVIVKFMTFNIFFFNFMQNNEIVATTSA